MGFNNKNVIVTGGAQGIGMAISMAFAKVGANIFIVDIDEEAGREHEETIKALGLKATFIEADVSIEEHVKKFTKAIGKENSTIDILINNAAISSAKSIQKRSMEEWDKVIGVNLRAPYMITKYSLPYMKRGSVIINIASTRALMSEVNTEPYSASKGGLLALTHSLAISLGELGIRVNSISPGWIDVSDWKKKSTRRQELLTERDNKQHPVGRVGTPNDIANACLYLADNDKSGFLTGTNLVIDGGMTVKMIYEEQ